MATANHRLGLLLVTGSALAWSTAGLFTRLIPLDEWTMLAWRGVFGGFGIFALMFMLGRKTFRADIARLGLPGFAYAGISALGMVLFIVSLRYTTVAHVSVIYATVPFVAALLAWLVLAERPSISASVASLLALAGVVVMVGFGKDGNWLGDLLAFGMTAAMAGMMVLARKFPSIPTMPAAALSGLLSAAASWPLGTPLAVSGEELGLLAMFGLLNSAIGLGLFTIGARYLPAIETALVSALDAPLGPVWVWLFFAETPTATTLIGSAIVFAAVAGHLFVSTISSRRVL